ncbi:TetR/AcrR family transcriptional regulator [Fibrivirga algicola]|uniref:TetR/AcrR family transcriptional regulator n=1 Tax=Fibrivirga algicola TaxID=2950420 RepID=A0ABX0QNL5_9BACT|nr:TetR/AcrR family transcriptional regulator [Fibrivirga algicola]ARK12825.1 TetR family transcriptional regulator [Fibrella sp. ES10-3-2-2]NID12861.1 TetR/AcrR family transcriptional regulator [Fibrivirga algicola]
MPVSTKERILNASIRLFNEYGVDAVRLQQIAEEIGISVGNLAYHFKTKDAIVDLVDEQVLDEFAHIFRQYLQAPELSAFDQQIGLYYQFFKNYQFYLAKFFKVNPERTEQQVKWQRAVNKMMIQLRSWLDFHVQRTMFYPERSPGEYDQLAQSLWMTLVFMPAFASMRGQTVTERSYKQAVWEQLRPHFTEEGISEFDLMVLPMLA